MTKTWRFLSAALLLVEFALFKYSLSASVSLSELLQTSTGKDIILDGQDTVWQVDSRPLSADSAAQRVTLRRATLRGAKLLVPKPTAPLALSTSGFFAGVWILEDLYIETTCLELEAFADLACGVQPAIWISSSGWSVRFSAFTPSNPSNGTFAISNVTLTCNPATEQFSTGIAEPAACVTVTADNPDELLALLSYDATLYGRPLPPPTSHLYIALTSNISLDGEVWRTAPPMLHRLKTTIAGAPTNVTAMDLVGRNSLIKVYGGAILHMVNLELVNLATDTLHNMPRGLASGAVWAVEVDIPNGSRLWLENCTLVLTPNEFVWQSYYTAQALANTAISASVSSYLPVFQGALSPSELRWRNVSSPHTLWRECRLVVAHRVYEVTVPNSFLTQYLGLTLYLSDLHMVYTCQALLAEVRAASSIQTSNRYVVSSSPVPYAIVLGTNISLADCWPVGEGVAVTAPAVTLMGLPDHTTILDLDGRADALILAPSTILSIRYLTLIGLSVHGVHTNDGAALSAGSGSADLDNLGMATALLWAFHFTRLGLQVQLERVTLVLPYLELEQYDTMYGSTDETLPYFQGLRSYLTASSSLHEASVVNATPPPSNITTDNVIFSKSVPKRTLSDTSFDSTPTSSEQRELRLSFQVLLLPGVRGTQVDFTSWPGEYVNWSASIYYSSSDEGRVWRPWRIAVLSVCLSVAALVALSAAVVYGTRRKRLKGGGAHGRRNSGSCWQYSKSQQGDIEGGGDGVCGSGNGQAGAGMAPAAAASGDGASGVHGQAQRRPLYDSFDDPVFELDLVKDRSKLTSDDVADILERANMEAAEFNLQLTEICGSGSFGVVYGGIWHGIKVAIKTMVFSESSPQLVGGQVARQQCIREAAFCCTMHHPNVVTTHHFYLKSAKRATMFDELHQVDNSSSEDEPFQRRPRRNRNPGGEGGADSVVRPPRRRTRRPRPPLVKPAVTHWRLYLIQEYCDGGTLRQAVDQGILFKHDGAKRAAEADATQHVAPNGRKGRKLAAQSRLAQPQSGAPTAVPNLHSSSELTNSPIESLIPDLQHVLARCISSGPSPQLAPPSMPSQRLPMRAYTTVDSTTNTADSNAIATTTTTCMDGVGHATVANVAIAAGMERPQLVQLLPATALVPLPLPRPGGGGRLADVGLAASGPEEALPEDLSAIIHTALGVASGVAYLHSRSIIHGDLSANNVLLVKTQVPALPVVAKLSDFGLSMRLEKGQDHLKNVHHGTPYYQSPEVMEQGTCSLAADVYSLGVLLWELYHGPPPWRAKKHKVHKRPCLADITIPPELLALANPQAAAEIQQEQEQRRAREQEQREQQQEPAQQREACDTHAQEDPQEQSSSRQQKQQDVADGNGVEVPTSAGDRGPIEKEPVNEQGTEEKQAVRAEVDAGEEDLWDDPHYRLRACDVLQFAPHCPERYAELVRRCLSPEPQARPSARSVVKSLLRMERGLTAAALAADGIWATSAGAPVGAVMALSKPHTHVPMGMSRDAALLLEDFDVAAAAVTQALARVTAEPAVAGAPASAGATAAASRAMCSGMAGSVPTSRATDSLRWLANNGGIGACLPDADTKPTVSPAQRPEAAGAAAEGQAAQENARRVALGGATNGDIMTLE